MCDSIGQFEIDIVCLAETNTNWKHQSSKIYFQATKKRHWKHSHSITSETDIEWSDIYKPNGTVIITLPPFSPSITTSGSDPTGLGRWSYITISGRNNIKLIIISAYRVCQNSIKHTGPSTNIRQHWQRLEEENLKDTNIRDLMINDLAEFISILLSKKHEIIVGIDANEANNQPKNCVDKLLQLTKLIDVISQQHGIRKGPNTHIRGRKHIEFFLCSEHIYTFIDKSGITPFNEITSSDHRGFFLDLRLKAFLKNAYFALPDHSSRPLQSSNTKNVLSYKRHLQSFVVHHKIIEQATEIQKKLVNKSITSKDYIIINKLDTFLTKSMIKAERMITKYGPQFP